MTTKRKAPPHAFKPGTSGNLLPGEGQTLSGIVEAKRRAIETQELADRITQLENLKGDKHGKH